MKISLANGGKKEDEVPILPRFVSDSIIDLQDEKVGVKAEIEAVDQAKLVSSQPCPTTNQDCHEEEDEEDLRLSGIVWPHRLHILLRLGISLVKTLFYCRDSIRIQREHHNNLVRFVNVLKENQNIVYNGINDVMTKVSQLTRNHNDTKDELYVVEYFVNDLHKDLQTLKDSVKHIEDEKLHSDDDIELDVDDDSHDVVLDYPTYPDNSSPISPMAEGNKDSDDPHYDDEDEEYPINYMMSTSTTGSPPLFDHTSQATH